MAGKQGTSCSWSVLTFGAARQWKLTAATLAVVVAAALGSRWSGFSGRWETVDPIITLGTLGAALMVWFGEAGQDWRRSLPQQVTVEFWMRDRGVAFRCERAPLLDEAPRAWAQQIGFQMNGSKLCLWPVPEADAPKIERWQGQWVRHLFVRFELREWPEHLDPNEAPRIWNHDNEFGRADSPAARSP
jgi:hypothetical protein